MVVANKEQQITLSSNQYGNNEEIHVTAIYAKCTFTGRKDLWTSIEDISCGIHGPWCIGGDFNVIMDPE